MHWGASFCVGVDGKYINEIVTFVHSKQLFVYDLYGIVMSMQFSHLFIKESNNSKP